MCVPVEPPQVCVSSQSISLNCADSSQIVTEDNYVWNLRATRSKIEFITEDNYTLHPISCSSYLLDRQVSSFIFFLSLCVFHAQTCPIYVKPARAKCNLFLVGITSLNQKPFYSLYKSLICLHTCPFMPV